VLRFGSAILLALVNGGLVVGRLVNVMLAALGVLVPSPTVLAAAFVTLTLTATFIAVRHDLQKDAAPARGSL
jgi:hypothetical protein